MSEYATVNGHGDIAINSDARPLIDKRVRIVKQTKSGRFLVYDEETKALASLPKRNLDFEEWVDE